tara:strand:- start:2401 stop:3246 length:846 start_codon:yes stop_codon:yes gene_type:complete
MSINNKWNNKLGVGPINVVPIQDVDPTQSRGNFLLHGPPRQIPLELYDEYTLGGEIGLRFWYSDETSGGKREPNRYTREIIDEKVALAKEKKLGYYGKVADYIHEAFSDFPVREKSIAIMGSNNPVCEGFCLAYDSSPIVIEYNEIICEDDRIKTYTVEEFYNDPFECDTAISISSFEHDGLGQYGDPLDPNGDLKAMQRMKDTVKKDGILYLAVPIGMDRIDWNVHRVYGRLRLPMLLEGWEVLKAYGFDESMFTILPKDPREEKPDYGYHHALFVLKNS